MRVALISPFYPPSVGGVEQVSHMIATGLAKRGYEVHVITTPYSNSWTPISTVGVSVEEGAIIHRLPALGPKVGFASIMNGLSSALLEVKPDIVHVQNLHPHLFQSALVKRRLGFKLVAQLHYPPKAGIEHMSARALIGVTSKVLAFLQPLVDVFTAHVPSEAKWLIGLGISPSRVRLVKFPCVPGELILHRPSRDFKSELGADILVTSISRLQPKKNQHLLLKAVSALVQEGYDVKAYIAGPVSDLKYLELLRRFIEVLPGLKRSVILKPEAVDEHVKRDLVASSDVFALTPAIDFHPLAVLEALALGTPSLTSNTTLLSEVVPEAVRSGFLAVTSPDTIEITNALLSLIERRDSINREQIKNMMRRRTCEMFLDDLELLYQALLSTS